MVLEEDGRMASETRTLTVTGTTETVTDTLYRIREAIRNRKALGFPLLKHDEEWMFIGKRDERECTEICRPLEHTMHRGNYIPRRFPYYAVIDSTHIYARAHMPRDDHCRCILELQNPSETMRNRLHNELTEVL